MAQLPESIEVDVKLTGEGFDLLLDIINRLNEAEEVMACKCTPCHYPCRICNYKNKYNVK